MHTILYHLVQVLEIQQTLGKPQNYTLGFATVILHSELFCTNMIVAVTAVIAVIAEITA